MRSGLKPVAPTRLLVYSCRLCPGLQPISPDHLIDCCHDVDFELKMVSFGLIFTMQRFF